jgi:hypothetical protein
LVLPACVAWMVHVPTATSVTVVPETVHTPVVCEKKLTVRPELAVAFKTYGAPPYVWLGMAGNVMVCITWVPPPDNCTVWYGRQMRTVWENSRLNSKARS